MLRSSDYFTTIPLCSRMLNDYRQGECAEMDTTIQHLDLRSAIYEQRERATAQRKEVTV